jgi:hypothetical protein
MSDTLRSGLIRLAFANPELRADLLPLIEKEAAGKKQDKVRAVNEKGTVVWVNKDTLRKQPGKFKPYKHEEDEGKGGGAEKSEGKESGGGGKTKSPIPVKMYEYIGPDAVVIGKSIKDGVSLPPKKSETVLGVLERAIAGVKSGKDSADPTVLKHYKSLAKHLKGEVDKRNKALVKHPQSVRDIANEHDLPAVDVAEVQAQAKSLADKNAKSRKSPEQRKQEFLKNIDPSKYSPKELAAMKERIKKMSAGDFEKMVFALAEDEGGAEGGAEGGGKTASLRSGLIRLAYANPSLRPTLLPLIEKHAGEMDAELEEDADPTSHDQNLPEHYYFNKGAAGKGESVEAILKQFASPASKNQNKPESYYGLAPKGKQAAKEKNDYSPDTGETGKLRDDLVKALKKKGLEVEEGSSANTLYIDGEKVAIHGPHLEGEYVKEWVRKPSRKEWLDEAVKLLGKKASVKVAAAGGWSAVFAAFDKDMPSFDLKGMAGWNKVYKRLVKEGVSVGDAGAAAHFYWAYRAKEFGVERADAALTEFGAKPPSGYGAEKQASVKTAGGSGAANAAFLRQSPLKDKVLRAVAKHYGVSVSEIEDELTDPNAEALYEYIGNDRALQMQVYREFKK